MRQTGGPGEDTIVQVNLITGMERVKAVVGLACSG